MERGMQDRIALIVGINHYPHGQPLHGCVADAREMQRVLARHGTGQPNFDCRLMVADGSDARGIARRVMKDAVKTLFAANADIALFYFAGHGHIESTGGYLLGSDAHDGDDGLALNDVLTFANASPARNTVVILDSCHSGIAGTPPGNGELAMLSEGLTVLTASSADQYANERDGHGVFSALMIDALEGAAANLTGDITPGSVYAHIDQSLGAWEQRPIFKTNVRQFVSLRSVAPPIELDELRRLPELFVDPKGTLPLDPSFEPELAGRPSDAPPPDPSNTERFALLQKMNRLNLVVPVDAPHMWNAAMARTGCRLTALGEHYRRLVEKGRIWPRRPPSAPDARSPTRRDPRRRWSAIDLRSPAWPMSPQPLKTCR